MTPPTRKFLRPRVIAPLLLILFAIFLLPGASLYYSYSRGRSCTKCHEIWQPYRDWHESSHRNIACSECHGDVMTLDAGYHLKNLRQLAAHLRGEIPELHHRRGREAPPGDRRSRGLSPRVTVRLSTPSRGIRVLSYGPHPLEGG